LICSAGASAQQPPAPPPYGSPGVTLDQAKKAVDAAEAEAKKNGWRMAIVVVSNAGDLIHFSRIDDTQFGSTDVAIRKAKSAAAFRRPTKVFQDALTARACRHLRLMRQIESGWTREILKMAEIGFKAGKMGASLESHIVERCPMGTDCSSFAWQEGRSWPVGRGQSAVY
jgi:hypothetical protein